MDLTEEGMDAVLHKMAKACDRVADAQGSIVKLPKAEVDLLISFEAARNFMMSLLKSQDTGRENLQAIFGGDCTRVSMVRAALESVQFSGAHSRDQRIAHCMEACETVETVLKDLGLGWALKQAQENENKTLRRRVSTIDLGAVKSCEELGLAEHSYIDEDEVAEIEEGAAEEAEEPEEPAAEEEPEEPAVEETPAEEAPEPKRRPKGKARPKGAQRRARSPQGRWVVDEELITRMFAATLEELLTMEPDKTSGMANWMIWMVHRAHLDDPSLDRFDFTNLRMPPSKEEPRICPKLAKAMATNTHITSLILPNSNLGGQASYELGVSIGSNTTLRELNVDSNYLATKELESVARGCADCKTLEVVRANNQHSGPTTAQALEAWLEAVKSNESIVKLGMTISDNHLRGELDKYVMKNNDLARKRKKEARDRGE